MMLKERNAIKLKEDLEEFKIGKYKDNMQLQNSDNKLPEES
jgi:hypothetical protein